jgi:hypothetical protein
VLATLLGHHHTTLDTIPLALGIYDTIRQSEQDRRTLNCHYFTFHGVDYDSLSGDTLQYKLQSLAATFMSN